MSTSEMPTRSMHSASAAVATAIPHAPNCIWRAAIQALRCPFA